MGRIRLALLLLLLVTLPGIGIAFASTGVGPDRGPASPVPVPVAVAPTTAAATAAGARAVQVEAAKTRSPKTSSPVRRTAASVASVARVARAAAARAGAARTSSTPGDRAGTARAGRGGAGSGPIRFGVTYRGFATFYAADGGGNCSFPPGGDLMVGAMNQHDYAGAAACGAYVAVRASNGRKVTIRVTDRCPECPAGAIDLSRQAFTRLAAASVGRVNITWHLLSPALGGPVSYTYKEGSSRYWCAIQVRNHRNPIASLQVRTGSTWRTLPRAEYNYFESTTGAGCGGAIRITDSYGNRLTDTGIAISPGRVQPGHAQLPAR